jgi:HPt (histidine-containing phosphotransfer) domain-containing protein
MIDTADTRTAGDLARYGVAPESPILKDQLLQNLRAVVPADSFATLIDNWLVSLAERIERLTGQAAAGDLADLKRTAHDMAGTCGCFGAIRLGELARQLEAACGAGDLPNAQRLVSVMQPVTTETRDALRQRFL